VKVDKARIVEFIRQRGDESHADRAEQELPQTLDLPQDNGLLAQYGVSADDLDDPSVWGR